MNKPKRLDRKVVYKSEWINVYTDRVQFPSGKILEEHHILDFHSQAVGVVVENSREEVLFVQVFRYALDAVTWEIPAGRIDKGESPIDAAIREVQEESGYETSEHKLVYSFYPIDGISDEKFHIVFCKAGRRTGDFDRDEINDIKWVHKDKLKQMIQKQELCDGLSLSALLLYSGVSLS
ncbi:MAG: NUDIX hydrolase [Calditrichaeota bacterium]|jgi:ADP-ribose pyrophosphatase|nr:NUDIX hydrolase [Calditrichota bacterium]MBT7788303.1 NUDIX hydrolase [Calditrichota bacterium]